MANKHIENDIQSNIRVELSKYGIVLRHQVGLFYTITGNKIKVGVEGEPDLMFVGKGIVAWLEVKKPGGRRREKQEKFIALMKSMGHVAGFVESVEDALKLIGVDKE